MMVPIFRMNGKILYFKAVKINSYHTSISYFMPQKQSNVFHSGMCLQQLSAKLEIRETAVKA